MCGGFTCSKNALISLNVLYVLVGILLISCAVYGRASNLVINLPILGGILACGIILIIISIMGLIGAVRHHQVILFFYMIILFILFLVQFSIACSCLAVNQDQQKELADKGWHRVSDDIKQEVQDTFQCCGFNSTAIPDHPSCEIVNKKCCPPNAIDCSCSPCLPRLQDKIDFAFRLCGGIGLFFSFTEVLAVFIARRFRNQHDPMDLPSRAVFPKSNYQYS
ncbi:unnamed protein product [Diamesa hyperborea]